MKLHLKKPAEIFGFCDKETAITGELNFAGVFRIDGDFHGSISTEGTLVIGPRACVYADIKVGAIEIAGSVFGNIDAIRSVEVCSTGRVRGDVHTPVLTVSPGGTLNGLMAANN